MSDVWFRVALVGGVLVVSAAVVMWRMKRASRPRVVERDASGLEPGIYFFSSATCPSCARARAKLEERLVGGYVEFSWEGSPAVFEDLDIEKVPAVMIVEDGGSGSLFTGQPDRALRRL